MSERFWASGHWQVKEGKAEEFIQQWKEWLSRSSENVSGFHHARLLRSLNSPQQLQIHFRQSPRTAGGGRAGGCACFLMTVDHWGP
jgi:Antibiotic biosynthesis monooxygenase